MKAIVIEQTGGPEQLALQDVPDPDVSEGQSLFHVRAAGVNFLDLLVRQGNYAQAPELPTIPGVEVAGETEDGRRVMALLTGGGYAERSRSTRSGCIPLPEGASFAEGASFLLTFLTAWIPLTRQVRLEPGQTVLVHAGSGGVGTAAIQCARHLGARVVATASTEEKRQFCLEQGAEEAFGYDEFAEAVRPDVVMDPVGGDLFAPSVCILSPLGTLVAIGYAGGWWQELNPALLVGRNVGVQGFYLGRLMARRPDVVVAGRRASCSSCGLRRDQARGRRGVPARGGGGRPPADRGSQARGESRPRSVAPSSRAARRGSAPPSSAALEGEGAAVQSLDLTTGFDVSDPAAWEDVDGGRLRVSQRRRRRVGATTSTATGGWSASTSTASYSACGGWSRSCRDGGSIVATASLAGLMPMPRGSDLHADEARSRRLRARRSRRNWRNGASASTRSARGSSTRRSSRPSCASGSKAKASR